MKTSILAARDARAQKRIMEAAEALSERFGLEIPAQMRRQIGNPSERAMQQREGIADLLDMVWFSISEQPKEASTMLLTTAVELVRGADEDHLQVVQAVCQEEIDEALRAIGLANAVKRVRGASDEDLLAISGVGEATLASLRRAVAVPEPDAGDEEGPEGELAEGEDEPDAPEAESSGPDAAETEEEAGESEADEPEAGPDADDEEEPEPEEAA
jgi:hypothetical protein